MGTKPKIRVSQLSKEDLLIICKSLINQTLYAGDYAVNTKNEEHQKKLRDGIMLEYDILYVNKLIG